jgi:hypothetical protein
VYRLLGAGICAASAVLGPAAPVSATNWGAGLSAGSKGEAQAGKISELVDNTCTAAANGTSCGTADIMPNAGGSGSVSITNNGNAPSSYALSATGCGAATLNDHNSTLTVAHGGFTASSYQASGPDSGYSLQFDGSTTWLGLGGPAVAGPQTFTELAWFKTTSPVGGGIIGFQTTMDPGSAMNGGHWDRLLWFDNSGHVWAGVNPSGGSPVELESPSTYRDGSWHFVAFTDSASGIGLYIDGGSVASSSTVGAQSYDGWWSVGAAQFDYFPNSPTVNGSDVGFFNGNLAGVAVLSTALSGPAVSSLYASSSFASYSSAVQGDSTLHYWSLQDAAPTGPTASAAALPGQTVVYPDLSGSADDGTASGGVSSSASGPLGAGAATTFDGSTGYIMTANSYGNPENISEVAWFKTASSSGGTILGFSNAQGDSGQTAFDRMIWVDNSGKVVFAVYPGAFDEVTSAGTAYGPDGNGSYNDGSWHMVAAEIGVAGEQLWVDGTEVGHNNSVTSASTNPAYWHIGWETELNWSDAPTSSYFSGSIAGVAIIASQLSASQLLALYGSSNFGTFSGTVINDGASEYWPLTFQSNACTAALVTVSVTASGTTTCLLPPLAAGAACPAVATGGVPLIDLTDEVVPTAVTVSATGTATLTIKVADNGALPTALSGADVQVDATVSAADNAWQAGAAYLNSQVQL